jgi:hypothetical protein
MQNQFTASQTVQIPVREVPGVPIEHYLAVPQRLVAGLTEDGGVEQLGPEEFRLRLRSLQFFSLQFVPVATLRVYAPAPGEICIESQDCQLMGAETFNQHFQLQLNGVLQTQRQGNIAQLVGRADLRVGINVPPPFNLTPNAVINATGNSLLKGILKRIQLRLKQQLMADYERWAQQASASVGARSSRG